MSAAVVVVGSYNRDHVWHIDRAPQAGETRRGHAFATGPGGKGFNQAVACARQGVATAFIGCHGDDALGRDAEALARSEGIAGYWLTDPGHATGSACIVVDAKSQNRIVVALGANEHLHPDHLTAQAPLFASARVLLVQMENNLDATAHALDLAQAHGLLSVLNPAPVHAEVDTALLAAADILTPNEGEFAELVTRFGGPSLAADTLAERDDATLHALARRLTGGSVVITLGAHGCFVSHGADTHGDATAHYRLAAEPVHATDTTAAGDAFCGSLAAALVRLHDAPMRAAVAHANRSAAMTTERHGAAAAMVSWDDVSARFDTP